MIRENLPRVRRTKRKVKVRESVISSSSTIDNNKILLVIIDGQLLIVPCHLMKSKPVHDIMRSITFIMKKIAVFR